MAQTYRLVLAYAGGAYFGWQRLAKRPTIQGTVESAIANALQESAVVAGAGRTDRGAHAEGQVAAFRLEADLSPDYVIDGLNEALPKDIRVISVEHVADDFHPRTDAISKIYSYVIANTEDLPEEMTGRMWHIDHPLDVDAMREAASALVGRHDFQTFATKPRFAQKSTVREIHTATVESNDGLVTLTFHADSFLNHMVRNMVRALVKVGEGRWPAGRVAEALAAKDRNASPGSAPAHGLYLVRVFYRDEEE